MVKFETLLGPLSLALPHTSITLPPNFSAPCCVRGALVLQGRDLLGPGDPKSTWELLGYQVGIQQFKITLEAPISNIRISNADRPIPDDSTPPNIIVFQPRQWTSDGQIAVAFTITIPQEMLPPHNATFRYQVAASATVAVINKDLGMGPNFMHRVAPPVAFDISCPVAGMGWPWPQQQQHQQQAV